MRKKKDVSEYTEFERFLLNNYNDFSKNQNGLYVVYKRVRSGKVKSRVKEVCGVCSEDAEGGVIIPCVHTRIFIKEDGIVATDFSLQSDGKAKWSSGYYDLSGKRIVPCEYFFVHRYGNLIKTITFDDRFGIYNALTGEHIIRDCAKSVIDIGNYLLIDTFGMNYLVNKKDGSTAEFVVDKFNNKKKSRFFDGCEFLDNSKTKLKINIGRFCGAFDLESGKELLPCIFDSVMLQNNCLRASNFGYIGLYDKTTGKTLVPCLQDGVIESQHFFITSRNKKYGAYLKNGRFVVDNVAEEINVGKDGIEVCVRKGENMVCGFYDNDGKKVLPIRYSPYEIAQEYQKRGIAQCQSEYDDVYLFGNHLVAQKNGKEGVLDARTRKPVLECKYDEIVVCDEGFFVRENKNWGFFTIRGKKLYDCEYTIDELYGTLIGRKLVPQPQQNY